MYPSSGQHQEMIHLHPMENLLVCSKPGQERKPRPQPEQALKCPRCDSLNTKFCYYNNYSLSQPRYFCKSCRRYWTKGGTLRNVPVGGGCRKHKRSSSLSSSKRTQDQPPSPNTNPFASLPPLTYDSNELTLAFARLQKQPSGQLGFDDHDLSMLASTNGDIILGNSTIHNSAATPAFLGALRSGFLDTQNANYLQYLYYGYGNGHIGEVESSGVCVSSGEMVPPYEDVTSVATTQAVTVTAMKQEACNGREDHETSKVLWGFPWHQLNGSGNIMGGGVGGDFEPLRQSWNGLGTTCSPLM